MLDHEYFEEINTWIPEVIATSLARDLETNLKTLITARSGDHDPATRDACDLQAQVLQRVREKLDTLEVRLARAAHGAGAGVGSGPHA